MSQPHFEASVRMRLAFPKMGTWSPPGFSKTQSLIAGVKTPRLEVFFMSFEIVKCRCRKWPRMHHSNICSTSYGRKKGRESNWQFDFQPLKVRNRLDPGVCRSSATHRWKALEESYKFSLDLVPIKGLSWELWAFKVPGVQTEIVSGLLFVSHGTKSHLDVGAVE
jgi:hypothetical protein